MSYLMEKVGVMFFFVAMSAVLVDGRPEVSVSVHVDGVLPDEQRCRWPCSWRKNPIWYTTNHTVWIPTSPWAATYISSSMPKGQQVRIQTCIKHDGDFFIFRTGNVFKCCKAYTLSSIFWYFYCSQEMQQPGEFCTMCDLSKMEKGAISGSAQHDVKLGFKLQYTGCNRPRECPVTEDSDLQCTGQEYIDRLDDGTNCEQPDSVQ